MSCWICGCTIGGVKIACEHVLPVLRAIMFSGLTIPEPTLKGKWIRGTQKFNRIWTNCYSSYSTIGKLYRSIDCAETFFGHIKVHVIHL